MLYYWHLSKVYKPLWRSSLHQGQSQFVRCQSAFTDRPKAFRVASKKKDKNPTCKTIENTTTFLVHHKWNKWKCTGVSVSYRLSVNTHTKKKNQTNKKRPKANEKGSKPNRLRGSFNLQSVTWTFVLNLDIFFPVSTYLKLFQPSKNNCCGQTQNRGL